MRGSLVVGLVFLLAFLVVGCSTSASAQVTPSNIVFVLADDMRYDEVAYLDGLQEFAASGLSFSRYYVTDPQCCPSRATILTGRYPQNTGVLRNPPSNDGWEPFIEKGNAKSYLPRWLDDAGYATALYGKLMNGYGNQDRLAPGFDETKISEWPRQDGSMTKEAVRFFGEHSGEQPVAVFLWLRSPHDPMQVPDEYAHDFDTIPLSLSPAFNESDVSDKPASVRRDPLSSKEQRQMLSKRRSRLEMGRRVEEAIQAMVGAARVSGELDDTYFVFSSDNGYLLGEHRLKKKSWPYSEAAHQPLIVSGPGIPAGATTDALAANHDLAPTIMELAGLPIAVNAPPVDGRSLVPLLSGQEPTTWRDAVLVQHPHPGEDKNSEGYRALYTAQEELYAEWEKGWVEHYTDVYQTEPANAPARQAELETKLDALKDCSGDSCRRAEDAAP